MKKIPTLFVRDANDRRFVTEEVTPGCEWVLRGEGVPLRKYDGTCVMFDGQKWWARREVKPNKTAPENFVEVHFDEVTGKKQGWEPIEQSPFAKQFQEAFEPRARDNLPEGTYELIGPKINGNPEGAEVHVLVKHSMAYPVWFPLDADTSMIKDIVRSLPFEGVVWHHPDGRMAKLKGRDLRPINTKE